MKDSPEFMDLMCKACDGEGAILTPTQVVECTCTWGMRCPDCLKALRLTIVEFGIDPREPEGRHAIASCDECEWSVSARGEE